MGNFPLQSPALQSGSWRAIPGMDGETPVVALVGGSASSITMPVASVAGVRKVPQAWSGTEPGKTIRKESWF